jgi:hypothetical protein
MGRQYGRSVAMGAVSEASLAALLAEVLADRHFWGELASAQFGFGAMISEARLGL